MLRRLYQRGWRFRVALTTLLVLAVLAISAPWLAPMDPNALSDARLSPPSTEHLMGTDQLGRDVLSRFLLGAGNSLSVALGAVLLAIAIGCTLGAVAGWRYGSWLDQILMRTMDVVLSFPLLIILPVLSGILVARSSATHGAWTIPSPLFVSVAIGFVLIPTFARLTRGSVISESTAGYVVAAKSFGMPASSILTREILPNVAGTLIVQATFSAAIAIMLEAAVSFLGFGVQPPGSSWGLSLADGQAHVAQGAWWLVLFPSLGIVIAVVAINVVGDELRDILDPNLEGVGTS